MDIADLTQTLSQYSAQANAMTNLVYAATKPFAHVLIGVFVALELNAIQQHQLRNGGTMTQELFFGVLVKYLIALILVENARLIFDVIMAFGNGMVKGVDKLLPVINYNAEIDLGNVKGIEGRLVTMVARIVEYVSGLSVKILLLVRSFELYVLRAVSGILVALFLSETTKPITVHYLKVVAAAIFQMLIILIIVRLYPVLVTKDLLTIGKSANLAAKFAVAFASIAKGVIFIYVIFGSQKLAKNLLNAM